MAKRIRKSEAVREERPAALGELIHVQVRVAIEAAVHEELARALGAERYERHDARRGYRNGVKTRTLTGPTGPLALTLPRATVTAAGHPREWTSTIVPRYQRRMREVNEAVIATYLAGGNQRRIRGALQPLLKAAPLSKSAVSRIVATLKDGLTAWTGRPLTDIDLGYLYLDAVCVRVRSAGKVASVPVLTAVAVLILRVKYPHVERPFRVPAYPLVPLLFCVCCLAMIVSSVFFAPWETLLGLGMVATGLPLYWLSERLSTGRPGVTLRPVPVPCDEELAEVSEHV